MVLRVLQPIQMSAAEPIRSTNLDCEIALISSPESKPLQQMIDYSRWHVTELPDLEAARTGLADGDCPIVICGTRDWRRILEIARSSVRPPSVVVVAPRADNFEWLQVLDAGAHYLPLDQLGAGQLFSLLNLLWRSWHKD